MICSSAALRLRATGSCVQHSTTSTRRTTSPPLRHREAAAAPAMAGTSSSAAGAAAGRRGLGNRSGAARLQELGCAAVAPPPLATALSPRTWASPALAYRGGRRDDTDGAESTLHRGITASHTRTVCADGTGSTLARPTAPSEAPRPRSSSRARAHSPRPGPERASCRRRSGHHPLRARLREASSLPRLRPPSQTPSQRSLGSIRLARVGAGGS